MSSEKKVTLVTGATGFIGKHLCQRLLDSGEYVRAVGRCFNDGPWQEFYKWDFSNGKVPPDMLHGVETVFHLASKSHSFSNPVLELETYEAVIVNGTRRLVEACKVEDVQTFVYFSSVKAMGEGNPFGETLQAIDETWPDRPRSPYGLAKSSAENIVRESNLNHTVVLRPVMVFGEGEKGNLPRMINAVKRGRFPPLPELGNKRSMVHVDDLVEWAILSAKNPISAGKTYILASETAVSTRELYDAVRESLGLAGLDWSIPMVLLKSAALIGSTFGRLFRRRLPFDMDTLEKLTGSSWYSSGLAIRELSYHPRHEIISWLTGQSI